MAWNEAYKTPDGNVITPRGAGKLKDLWDSVRMAGETGPAPTGRVDTMPSAPPDLGNVDADPTGPVVLKGEPKLTDMPTNARVQQLQGQVDQANARPSIKERVLRAAPTLVAAGLGAAFNAPALVQGASEANDAAIQSRNLERQNLTTQLEGAQRERGTEFAAASRETAAATTAAENRKGRTLAAQIYGQSRADVAHTTADSRRDVANIGADARRDTADTQAAARRDAAITAANARIAAGKYAADAAYGRQSRQFAHADAVQGRQFAHQDEKPTAAEDQRADYLAGLKENLDIMREIAKRRGDLFGKVAGRISEGRTWIGTDDQDLAVFNQAEHNLGILATSSHGQRAYRGNAIAANAVTNGMKNDPQAFLAATDSLEKSANSMGATYHRPTLAGRVGPGGSQTPAPSAPKPKSGGKASPKDPAGIL